MRKLILMVCLLMFLSINLDASSASSINFCKEKEPDIVIEDYRQKVNYFIEKGVLKAKVTFDLLVRSNSAVNATYSRAIFKDNTSDVSKLKWRVNKRSSKYDLAFKDYESGGIFHSDLRIAIFEMTFNKDDGPLAISYEKTFHDVKFLDPLYFNEMFEVEYSEIEVVVPNWLDLELVEWNFDLKGAPKKEVEKKKKETKYFYFKNAAIQVNKFYGQPRRNKMNPHIIPVMKSYTNKGETVRGMMETSDLYKWYAGLVSEMKDKPTTLKDKVGELVIDKTTDEDKIKAIFYWVQNNIRYIAFEYGMMGFKPEECQYVYQNKYGDCKGMANLTKQMLLLAGYDARLTWIGTSDLPYDYDLPSLVVDNHMICTVLLDGKYIYLDATEKYADLYNYAQRIQGKQVMIEDGNSFIINEVPEQSNELNFESIYHQLSIIDETTIVGKGELTLRGSNKSNMVYRLTSIPEKDWEQALVNYIGNKDKNVKLKLHELSDLEEREKDLKLSYDIIIENHITNVGSEMYFSPEIDYQLKSLEMPEERDVPYELRRKHLVDYDVIVDIPEGWAVSYLPESVDVENDGYKVHLSYESKDGHIRYRKKIDIKENLIKVTEFEKWNKSVSRIKEFYEDQIILKK